ncbi:MAG: hypothetical protein ACK5IB_13345 [Qingshengfaniella sp.]
MKLCAEQDLPLPRGAAFPQVSDIDALLAQMQGRHLRIRRVAPAGLRPEDAPKWTGIGTLRGLSRRFEIALTAMYPPEGYDLAGQSEDLRIRAHVDLADTAAGHCRMTVTADLSATSLSGRILMQSLHFLRVPLEVRLGAVLAVLAERLAGDGGGVQTCRSSPRRGSAG